MQNFIGVRLDIYTNIFVRNRQGEFLFGTLFTENNVLVKSIGKTCYSTPLTSTFLVFQRVLKPNLQLKNARLLSKAQRLVINNNNYSSPNLMSYHVNG